MSAKLDFDSLRELRERLAELRSKHRPSLIAYLSKDGAGFAHILKKPDKASVASTATCVMSLVAAGLWTEDLASKTAAVAKKLVAKRTSADLEENNPFSLSFMAEGILALQEAVPSFEDKDKHYTLIREDFAGHLLGHVKDEKGELATHGAISIFPYPPSAYLTQLVHRVLKRLGRDEPAAVEHMHRWARTEINKQIALIGAGSRTSDPLQLAYALILATNTLPDEQTTPEDKEIFSHALDVFLRNSFLTVPGR